MTEGCGLNIREDGIKIKATIDADSDIPSSDDALGLVADIDESGRELMQELEKHQHLYKYLIELRTRQR